jgi:UDPglucose--hexose-1-phosphate uridylyltransferase
MQLINQTYPHRRKNILTGDWVLVSPQRTQRPWQGKTEEYPTIKRPSYDRDCYLCPGNKRANGNKNPNYQSTYSFINDFSALTMQNNSESLLQEELLILKPELGICKVMCFSPDHSLSLAEMTVEQIETVIDLWQYEFMWISVIEGINYVQIFENRGEAMGSSNSHPHGQIWAQQSIPSLIEKETQNQLHYYELKKNTLLSDYIRIEIREKERIVYENEDFIVVVPFWAVWPFEILLMCKEPIDNISQMTRKIKNSFAIALKHLLVKYDNLFEISFPYSAGIHQSPCDSQDHPEWHFHMHFYPPLLRSAAIKKFMVGYEMLAEQQRDILPEYAAQILRELPISHFNSKINEG